VDQQESHAWLTLPENNIDDITSFACDSLLDTSSDDGKGYEGNDQLTSDQPENLSGMEEKLPLGKQEYDIFGENGGLKVDGLFAAESTPPRLELNFHLAPSPELKFTASEDFDLEPLSLTRSTSPPIKGSIVQALSPSSESSRSPTPMPSSRTPTLLNESKASPRFPFGKPPQAEGQPKQQEHEAPPLCVPCIPVHPSMVQLAMFQAGLPTAVPSFRGLLVGGPPAEIAEKKKRRRACQTCHNRKVVCKSSVPFAAYPCARCVKAGKGDECKPNVSKKRQRGPGARPKVNYPPLYDKTGKRIPRLADAHNVNVGQCERDKNCGRPNRHPGHCRSKGALPRSKRRRHKPARAEAEFDMGPSLAH